MNGIEQIILAIGINGVAVLYFILGRKYEEYIQSKTNQNKQTP